MDFQYAGLSTGGCDINRFFDEVQIAFPSTLHICGCSLEYGSIYLWFMIQLLQSYSKKNKSWQSYYVMVYHCYVIHYLTSPMFLSLSPTEGDVGEYQLTRRFFLVDNLATLEDTDTDGGKILYIFVLILFITKKIVMREILKSICGWEIENLLPREMMLQRMLMLMI